MPPFWPGPDDPVSDNVAMNKLPEVISSVKKMTSRRRGYHCYLDEQNPNWYCINQMDPDQKLFLSDVGLREDLGTANTEMRADNIIEKLSPPPNGLSRTDVKNLQTKSDMVKNADLILRQSSTSFAVQLFALKTEAAVLRYADLHKLSDPLYTRIESNGRRLYLLLLGVYPNRVSAQRARDTWVKQKDRRSNPWVRPIDTLQSRVVAANMIH